MLNASSSVLTTIELIFSFQEVFTFSNSTAIFSLESYFLVRLAMLSIPTSQPSINENSISSIGKTSISTSIDLNKILSTEYVETGKVEVINAVILE